MSTGGLSTGPARADVSGQGRPERRSGRLGHIQPIAKRRADQPGLGLRGIRSLIEEVGRIKLCGALTDAILCSTERRRIFVKDPGGANVSRIRKEDERPAPMQVDLMVRYAMAEQGSLGFDLEHLAGAIHTERARCRIG